MMSPMHVVGSWALAFGLMLSCPISAQNGVVSLANRKTDVLALDSWVLPGLSFDGITEAALSARHDLLSAMTDERPVLQVDWALAVHGWLRCADDAHLRVRFDKITTERNGSCPVPDEMLLDSDQPWSRFGPGSGVAAGARADWLRRTWPWVSVLGEWSSSVEVGADRAVESVPNLGGMYVEDHGAFSRWVIPSFGSGSSAHFSRDFRRCRRQLRRLNQPVMLDLRGNLGGFRSRRHAVLGVFLAVPQWPEEREREWSDTLSVEDVVEAMPLVRTSKVLAKPVAVMVDGLSFSASLLLADAMELTGRAEVFGCAPLGKAGGCTGSPEPRTLPGSRLVVDVPTRRTRLAKVQKGPYDLDKTAACDCLAAPWDNAVRWLLTSDLDQRR